MKKFEFQFDSIGCMEGTTKKITVLAIAPDKIDENTGAMLFCHGWGPNRFQMLDAMQATADKYNLFCISPEYRMSGYDYDPFGGSGWYRPYDYSFYQEFDELLAFRFLLDNHKELNRKRLFAHGVSQGGHLVLLASIFAPNTFAAIYSSSALTCVVDYDGPCGKEFYGRTFSEAEKNVRNVQYLVDYINTPLFMEHGTADEVVPHNEHTVIVEKLLKERNKPCEVIYYADGNHQLAPTITRIDAYNHMVAKFIDSYTNSRTDDFTAGSKIVIPCGEKTLSINWSKDVLDPEFMSFK